MTIRPSDVAAVAKVSKQIESPTFHFLALRRQDKRGLGDYIGRITVPVLASIPLLGFLLRERHFPNTSHSARLQLVLIFQYLIAACCITTSIMFGAYGFFLVPGIIVYYVVLCLLNTAALKVHVKQDLPYGTLLLALAIVGASFIGVMLLSIIGAAWLRADTTQFYVICSALLLIILAFPLMVISVITDDGIPWVYLAFAVTITPLILAWGTASAVTTKLKSVFSVAYALDTAGPNRVLTDRKRWAAFRGWRTRDDLPLTVIVMLSGGGYRAASIHAGLLHALDEQCVPIRYLSTVSGGSIVGTYYALGYTPQQFQNLLLANKPGLPDKYLSIPYLPYEWWRPGWSTSDTYSEHLDNTFFHGKVLADTDQNPQLIINATDIEHTGEQQAREIFYKGRNTQFPNLDQTRLAELVAASGAFPGAFQPKSIVWPLGDDQDAPQERRFVDGGVVENLGYSGWERFIHLQKLALPSESVLVISDASAPVGTGRLPVKIDLLTLLSRSQDISYDKQQSMLKQQIRAGILRSDFVRAQESLTSLSDQCFHKLGMTCLAKGDVIASEVGNYSTLAELDPSEINKSFWVGYMLGNLHWKDLNEWRLQNNNEAESCPVDKPKL
jgi:hypothetical protein